MFIVDFEKEGIAVACGEEEEICRDEERREQGDLYRARGKDGVEALGCPGNG